MLSDVNIAIGHAVSTDGKSWTKDTSPVLQKGAATDWDNYGVFAPSVVKNTDGSYDMWYTGGKGDLSMFFNYLQNTVTLNNFFLTGVNTAIGHATSTNGTTWTNGTASNPVLSKGAGSSAWDNYGIAFPSVVANAGYLRLWYTGLTASPAAALTSFLNGGNLTVILAAGSGTNTKIGYASAPISVTPQSGGGGGGGGGAIIGSTAMAGVTNITSAVNSQGIFNQNVNAWSDDNNVVLHIPAGTTGLTSSGAALAQISMIHMTTPPCIPNGCGHNYPGV